MGTRGRKAEHPWKDWPEELRHCVLCREKATGTRRGTGVGVGQIYCRDSGGIPFFVFYFVNEVRARSPPEMEGRGVS